MWFWWLIRSRMFGAFFFQAEDGIRDGRVTGVQTCALPIWTPTPPVSVAESATPVDPPYVVSWQGDPSQRAVVIGAVVSGETNADLTSCTTAPAGAPPG